MKNLRQNIACSILLALLSGMSMAQTTGQDKPKDNASTSIDAANTNIKSADIYSEGLIDAMKNYMDAFGEDKADNADAIISKVLDTLNPLINDNEDIANLYQEVLTRYAALALEKNDIVRWIQLNKEHYLVAKQWYMKDPEKFAKNMQGVALSMTICYIDEHQWDNAEAMAHEAQMMLDKLENLPEFKRNENQFLIDFYLTYVWSARGHLRNTLKFGNKALEEHKIIENTEGCEDLYAEERSYLEDELLAKCRTGK